MEIIRLVQQVVEGDLKPLLGQITMRAGSEACEELKLRNSTVICAIIRAEEGWYFGQIHDSKLWGKGRVTLEKKKTVLEAEFEDNLLHGVCLLKHPEFELEGMFDHNKLTFVGSLKDMKAEQRIVFVGALADYRPDGFCQLLASDIGRQKSEEGYYLEGKKNGLSTCLIGQNSFVGVFCEDRRSGFGSLRTSNCVYDGYWQNDAKHKIGRLKTVDFSYYGEFEDNRKQGLGHLKLLEEEGHAEYVGLFDSNLKSGYGRLIEPDSTYIGQFKADKRHGMGFEKSRGGDTFLGHWSEDRRSGLGILNTKKSVIKGVWLENMLEGKAYHIYRQGQQENTFGEYSQNALIELLPKEKLGQFIANFESKKFKDFLAFVSQKIENYESDLHNYKQDIKANMGLLDSQKKVLEVQAREVRQKRDSGKILILEMQEVLNSIEKSLEGGTSLKFQHISKKMQVEDVMANVIIRRKGIESLIELSEEAFQSRMLEASSSRIESAVTKHKKPLPIREDNSQLRKSSGNKSNQSPPFSISPKKQPTKNLRFRKVSSHQESKISEPATHDQDSFCKSDEVIDLKTVFTALVNFFGEGAEDHQLVEMDYLRVEHLMPGFKANNSGFLQDTASSPRKGKHSSKTQQSPLIGPQPGNDLKIKRRVNRFASDREKSPSNRQSRVGYTYFSSNPPSATLKADDSQAKKEVTQKEPAPAEFEPVADQKIQELDHAVIAVGDPEHADSEVESDQATGLVQNLIQRESIDTVPDLQTLNSNTNRELSSVLTEVNKEPPPEQKRLERQDTVKKIYSQSSKKDSSSGNKQECESKSRGSQSDAEDLKKELENLQNKEVLNESLDILIDPDRVLASSRSLSVKSNEPLEVRPIEPESISGVLEHQRKQPQSDHTSFDLRKTLPKVRANRALMDTLTTTQKKDVPQGGDNSRLEVPQLQPQQPQFRRMSMAYYSFPNKERDQDFAEDQFGPPDDTIRDERRPTAKFGKVDGAADSFPKRASRLNSEQIDEAVPLLSINLSHFIEQTALKEPVKIAQIVNIADCMRDVNESASDEESMLPKHSKVGRQLHPNITIIEAPPKYEEDKNQKSSEISLCSIEPTAFTKKLEEAVILNRICTKGTPRLISRKAEAALKFARFELTTDAQRRPPHDGEFRFVQRRNQTEGRK